jgi:hypothetical protein
MPIQFPPSPSVNQEYTYEGKVWAWDGSSWVGVRQETGIQKSNIWAKQNLLIPKRGFGLNSGYNGTTDQRRTKAGTIPMLKQYIERDLGEFENNPIVASGLVLHLDAGKSSSYPGSGTIWTDLSGRNNNGVLTNGPTYNSADGGYISFDGTNDYIENVTPNLGISGNLSATLSCWFYYTGASSATAFNLFSYGGSSTIGDTISLWINATTYNLNASFNGGTSVNSNTNAYLPNTWNNFVVTKTPGAINTTTKIYLNGVDLALVAGGSTATPNVVSRVIRIGRWVFDSSPSYFTGRVSQALIYNRALSQAEVTQNYIALKDRYGL